MYNAALLRPEKNQWGHDRPQALAGARAWCVGVLLLALVFHSMPCSARPQPVSPCVLNADGVQEPNEGPTDYSFLIRPAGRIHAVLLFVDFPDAPYTEAPSDLYSLLVPPAQKWLTEVSYGRVSLDVKPVNQWYRMSKPSEQYGFSKAIPSLTFEQHRTYVAEAVRLAAAQVDFRKFQIVLVVASKGSQLPVSPTFHARPGEGIAVDGGEVRHAITFGADIRAALPNHARNVFVHEMGHLMGLPDLYDYEGSRKLQWKFVGAWDNMSSILVGAHLLAYHKLKFGWLDERQVKCATGPGTVTATLTPLETRGGLKAIMMRTSPSSAYVVEVRQQSGVDRPLCDSGVLLYSVDAAVSAGHGVVKVLPAQAGTDPAAIEHCALLDNATYDLRADKPSSYADPATGITLRLESKRGDAYRVLLNWDPPKKQ